MQNALQLGQRQFPLQKILRHLTTSPYLFQYLRLSIIEETLVRWQQSPAYQTVYSEAELSELYSQISQLTKSPQMDASRVEAFKRSLTLKKYQQVHWGHRISSYFLVRKRSLDRAIFSAIQVDSLGMAQEIYLRVKERRQSLDKLARLYSQGAEAKLGGVLGPMAVERIHPQISYHLTNLKPGELSPLFQVDNFHVFVRLEQWLPAKFDDDIKSQLMEELFEQWLQTEISNRISSLEVIDSELPHARLTAIDPDEDLPRLTHTTTIDPAAEMAQSLLEIVDVEIVPRGTTEVPLPQKPLEKIGAGASFFPPVLDVLILDEGFASSDFATQSQLIQLTDSSQPRRGKDLLQQVIAFCVFFTLFLGGGLGAIYLVNMIIGTNTVQLEQQK